MGSGASTSQRSSPRKVLSPTDTTKSSPSKKPLAYSRSYGGEIIDNNNETDQIAKIATISKDNVGNYCTVKPTGGVATMIIKVGHEEYMNYDNDQPTLYGKLGELGDVHPLYKEDLVLMRCHQITSPEPEPLIDISTEIYTTYQLNHQQMAKFAALHQDKDICVITLRSEPVLFVNNNSSDLSQTPCHLFSEKQRQPFNPPEILNTAQQSRSYELQVRKEIVNIATVTDDTSFYYYNSSSSGSDMPHKCSVQADDDLMTLTEMISTTTFTCPNLKYHRCPLPQAGLPPLSSIDSIVDIITKHNGLLMIEDRDKTTPRSQFTACLALIIHGHKPSDNVLKSEKEDTICNSRCVDMLLPMLPDGKQSQQTVNKLLTQSTASNHTGNPAQDWLTNVSNLQQQQHLSDLTWTDISIIQMYAMLITFHAYWHSNKGRAECPTFSQWLRRQCTLMSYFKSTLSPFHIDVRPSHDSAYKLDRNCVRVNDYMCTMDSSNCSNLRKVPGLPIYGLSQPSTKGLQGLTNWLSNTHHHTSILLVSLTDIPTVICNDELYTLQYRTGISQPVSINNVTAEELKAIEKEISDNPKLIDTSKTLSNNQGTPIHLRMETVDAVYAKINNLTFIRLPIPTDQSPSEQVFEELQKLVEGLTSDQLEGHNPAIVFCCETGRDRTTTAMSIAGIIYSNIKGYPHGAGKGEADRISIWDAQFTKGEFKVIQQIIAAVPCGHQSKREVDFVLDQCFETSSMMHYHMREEIFVIVKKKQKLKKNLEKQLNSRAICVRGSNKGTGVQTDIKGYHHKLHKQSLDCLERYAMLIIFNCYLNLCNKGEDNSASQRMTFSQWLHDVGWHAGILDILDNLAFLDFEQECELKSRLARNCHFTPSESFTSYL